MREYLKVLFSAATLAIVMIAFQNCGQPGSPGSVVGVASLDPAGIDIPSPAQPASQASSTVNSTGAPLPVPACLSQGQSFSEGNIKAFSQYGQFEQCDNGQWVFIGAGNPPANFYKSISGTGGRSTYFLGELHGPIGYTVTVRPSRCSDGYIYWGDGQRTLCKPYESYAHTYVGQGNFEIYDAPVSVDNGLGRLRVRVQ